MVNKVYQYRPIRSPVVIGEARHLLPTITLSNGARSIAVSVHVCRRAYLIFFSVYNYFFATVSVNKDEYKNHASKLHQSKGTFYTCGRRSVLGFVDNVILMDVGRRHWDVN